MILTLGTMGALGVWFWTKTEAFATDVKKDEFEGIQFEDAYDHDEYDV